MDKTQNVYRPRCVKMHIYTTMIDTILADDLYYCVALVWLSIMAFAVGMALGGLLILCI